jgi:ADP-heptose:LPS heptosyltransferase
MYNLNWVYEDAWFRGDTRYIPDIYLKHFNLPDPSPPHPQLFFTEEEINTDLPKADRILVVNAISRWKIEGWKDIVLHAKKLGFFVVGIGQDRKGYHPSIPFDLDLRNQTTLRQMLSVVNAADAVVTLESGPLPVADCLGKPGIGLIFESEPQSILRTDTKMKCIVCHDLPMDFLKIRQIGMREEHLRFDIDEIKAEIDKL